MHEKTLSQPGTTSRSNGLLRKQSVAKSGAKHPLTGLQQSIGNRAVQRFIHSHYIQAKLTVGSPGDQFEQEADRMADTVMRMPAPQADQSLPITPVTAAPVQRKCAQCEEDEGKLQRKEAGQDTSASATAPPVVHQTLNSPGQPLSPATRAFFEPRFGYDFSQVRTHTGAEAETSAREVDALAYTVGSDIVFRDTQYAPETDAGRRLMAHELTHVVQQNGAGLHRASPDLLQRTPAPPNYSGVTGVRDLTKIRIDAVPDFIPNMLSPQRIVNAHINDPDVKHISWEFYDPNDQMMSGYSTLPGNPGSITSPFIIDNSKHFSGAFVPGNYLLRCIGRNASHQPIVYADRNFNVLKSDLTTGTALPTTYGELTFTAYNATDANPPATPRYSIDVQLKFLPKSTVVCPDVTFMQAMQTIDSEGRSQLNTVNADQDARKTPLAWSIDQLAGVPSPFYVVGRDPNTGNVGDQAYSGVAGRGGARPGAATLIDQPSWNRANNAKFESCVMCRSGPNRGQVYGCATWGYTATAAGKVTLMPRSFRAMPSDQFTEARAAWNTWRTNQPAAGRPDEAPALTHP